MSKFFINRPIVAIVIAILMVILADVFRDSAVPSVILTPNGLVLFWNAAAERLFGWSADEVLGRPLTSVLVPAHRADEHRQIRLRTLEGRGFSQRRITRRVKDGRLIEVSLSTWPIRGADGSVIGIIGIYADIGAEELRFRQSLAQKQTGGSRAPLCDRAHRARFPRC